MFYVGFYITSHVKLVFEPYEKQQVKEKAEKWKKKQQIFMMWTQNAAICVINVDTNVSLYWQHWLYSRKIRFLLQTVNKRNI